MFFTSPQSSPSQSAVNRRTQNRIDVELSITFESESNFFVGFSTNISEGGLFIATHDCKRVGSTLQVRFAIPDDSGPVDVNCAVRWVREYNPMAPDMIPGMGVEFTDLSPWDLERVQSFCDGLREPMFIDLDF
jgi:uncharacterized protein (TIGR02266 family)